MNFSPTLSVEITKNKNKNKNKEMQSITLKKLNGDAQNNYEKYFVNCEKKFSVSRLISILDSVESRIKLKDISQEFIQKAAK